MDDVKILEGAKWLLLEKGWTQGACARNTKGFVCFVTDPGAACFCLVGALSVASRGSAYGQLERVNRALRRTLGQMDTDSVFAAEYNDARGRTREEVIALTPDRRYLHVLGWLKNELCVKEECEAWDAKVAKERKARGL